MNITVNRSQTVHASASDDKNSGTRCGGEYTSRGGRAAAYLGRTAQPVTCKRCTKLS